MKIGDVVKMFIIIAVFGALFFANMFSVGLKKLKEEWPKHKCNPMYMPFAGYLGFDTMQNFQQCVGGIMSGMMNRFMEPILQSIGWITSLSSSILNSVSYIRNILFKMKETIFGIFRDIMGIFLNVLLKFQRFTLKMKDLMMKMGGTMATVVYIAEGLSMAGNSIWKGPIGGLLRLVCFNPNTLVTMNDGSKKIMKDIVIGDKLKGDIEVYATMKIKGNENSNYYKIYSKELKDYIYVTGDHLIQDPVSLRFIHVADLDNSIRTDIYDKELSCLVTSTHTIPIGEYIFWDWED